MCKLSQNGDPQFSWANDRQTLCPIRQAIIKNQKSILSIGITGVKGNFKRGEIVSILDENGVEFARGIANYDIEDVDKIKAHHSNEIQDILGFKYDDDVVIKDNLVLI